MDLRCMSRAVAWRPMPAWTLLVAGLMLAPAAGCGHHRSAYRPIYAAPAPAVVVPSDPCPSGDCPPAATISPGFEEGVLTPAPAPEVLPPAGSSVVPQPGGEPTLDPGLVPEDSGLLPTSKTPALEPLRETRGATPASSATLGSHVRPFVNDPNDLFQPPKADRPWQYIVLHHSDGPSGSYAEIDRLHRDQLGTAGCGYHFVIGNGSLSPDGQIEVTQRWSDQKAGAHCRDARSPAVNDYGIGICLVGDLDSGPPTPRQVEAARALVAYLRTRYAIPAERTGSHAQLAQNPTACPGRHFPAEAILGDRNLAARKPIR